MNCHANFYGTVKSKEVIWPNKGVKLVEDTRIISISKVGKQILHAYYTFTLLLF